MATSDKKPNPKATKIKPTIFPLGLSISQVESSLIIIDFIDVINGKLTILESVALPPEKAAQLSKALNEVLENGKFEG